MAGILIGILAFILGNVSGMMVMALSQISGRESRMEEMENDGKRISEIGKQDD